MTAVAHPTPALLREAADRIERSGRTVAGLADVRGHIRDHLRARLDVGTLAADDARRQAMSDLEAYQLRRPVPATAGELVAQLRAAAAWREQLDTSTDELRQQHLASFPGGAR
ncbi:hypothetical protein AB0I55_29360 [Actinocatenispora sera]|uniref:hypothetical protein n=1 Tax=Actinocatenispora sera TaxID=390989 RepID=UPI0033F58A15